MHLRCAGVPKKLYYLRAGRAPDYGVINHDYSLALYGFGYRIELYFHLVGSVACPGEINVLPMYLFFMNPIPYGIPDAIE